jgi:hypothetical protein
MIAQEKVKLAFNTLKTNTYYNENLKNLKGPGKYMTTTDLVKYLEFHHGFFK